MLQTSRLVLAIGFFPGSVFFTFLTEAVLYLQLSLNSPAVFSAGRWQGMSSVAGLPLGAALLQPDLFNWTEMDCEYQVMLTLGELSGPNIQKVRSSDSLQIWIEGVTKDTKSCFSCSSCLLM